MQAPLKEKLYFPPHLTNALAGIFTSRVTVVSAPPGAGKTTAIHEFLAKRQKEGTRVLWYTSFGEAPDVSWNRICDLLGEADARTAASLRPLGFPVQQTLSALAELVLPLQCPGETVLVIDNAQLLSSEISYDLLNALARHGCAHFHLVIATQTPMGAHMFPMSTEGILFLDSEPFVFSDQDAFAYFAQNGITLTDAELRQVMENTFGWVAALRLQLLGCRRTGRIQTEPGIERLLEALMWDTWPKGDKRFLLAFSLLESATMRQIRMLANCNNVPRNILNLLDIGPFIQYDSQSQTYALGGLLRTFLGRFFDELPPTGQKLMCACAGRACLLEGLHFHALRLLFRAGEYEEMLAVPITNGDMAGSGTAEVLPLLGEILAVCPPELLERHPLTLLRFAFEAGMRGDDRLYAEYRLCTGRALKIPGAASDAERRYLRGEYLFLHSFSMGNDLEKANAARKAAREALGGPSRAFDHRYYWTMGSPSVFAHLWSDRARLAETLDSLEQGMRDYQALAGGGTGTVELMRAEVLLHTGRLDDAEVMCHKAVYSADEADKDTIGFCADLALARLAILHGDIAVFLARLEKIRLRASASKDKTYRLLADQCVAFLQLLLGRTQDLPPWLETEVGIRGGLYRGWASFGMILHGKYLLRQKEYNHLLGLADLILAQAGQQHIQLARVYYHLFLACARQATGKTEEAGHDLRQALDIALPDEIYLPFAEHAAELAGLLDTWLRVNEHNKQADAIGHLAKLHHAGATRIAHKLFGAGAELTAREAEIANHAKQGLTNKQIAQALYVSPETVKKTMGSVFTKLEVKSRRQLEDIEFG